MAPRIWKYHLGNNTHWSFGRSFPGKFVPSASICISTNFIFKDEQNPSSGGLGGLGFLLSLASLGICIWVTCLQVTKS